MTQVTAPASTKAQIRRSEAGKLCRGWPWYLLTVIGAATVPVVLGIAKISAGVVRDPFDVYVQFMLSPVPLVTPAIASVLGTIVLRQELTNRAISAVRIRADIGQILRTRIWMASVAVGVAFAIGSFLVFTVSMIVWPLIGNPFVDPEVYGLTAEAAREHATTRVTFSWLLAYGDLTYGVAYSCWVGLSAGAFAGFASLCLLIIPNSPLAIAVPPIFFIVQSIGASLLNAPQAALLFSAYPFGLSASSTAIATSPTILLAVAVAVAISVLTSRAQRLAKLS